MFEVVLISEFDLESWCYGVMNLNVCTIQNELFATRFYGVWVITRKVGVNVGAVADETNRVSRTIKNCFGFLVPYYLLFA